MKLLLIVAAFQMGSPGDGETQAIALHPTNSAILYVGAAKGLCKTTKGGLDNWPAVGLETLSPRAVVVDPAAPDTVYAGTFRRGMYKSVDAGRTWQEINRGLTYLDIRAVVLSGNMLYAGTDGGGVFRSSDGGASWTEVNHGLIDKTVRSLVADPRDARRLYAGTWHGVYITGDGGAHWSADPAGLYDVDVAALGVAPSRPATLYAATNPRGVWRSDDAGKTWWRGAKPITEHLLSIAVDPSQPDHVYVGTRAGVFRSIDGGDSFERAGLAWSNSAWTLVFDAKTSPATLYYGGVGGVLKTVNGGKWWDVTGPVRP